MENSQISYPYAISRIRTNEASLLDINNWIRLYDGDSGQNLTYLSDIGYGLSGQSIDERTQEQTEQARLFIRQISPDPGLTDLFLLKTDAQNIKAILKGLLMRTSVDDILLEGGTVPLESLKEAFENDNYEILPEYLREAVDEFDPRMSPGKLSETIDKAVFKQIFSVLEKHRHKGIKSYFTSVVDTINLRTFLRAKELDFSPARLGECLIEGGTLKPSVFTELYSKPSEALTEVLTSFERSDEIKSAFNTYLREHDNVRFENRLDLINSSIIFTDYSASEGIAPVVGYLLKKENEARELRILFAFKRLGITFNLKEIGIE